MEMQNRLYMLNLCSVIRATDNAEVHQKEYWVLLHKCLYLNGVVDLHFMSVAVDAPLCLKFLELVLSPQPRLPFL